MLSKNEYFISPDKTISEALDQLNKVRGLGLIVVNSRNELVGSLTDGDIRRALADGNTVANTIDKIFHKTPHYATRSTSKTELERMTNDRKIKLVPIIEGHEVVDVFTVDDDETRNASVVIMAGGLGSRLGELTQDCPKPMLEVAGKPVLERIINNFTKVGFKKFYISVNFKAEIIENYFKDGEAFNCHIEYLRETKRLGTAGSLSLLPVDIIGPIVVTNGDLLTLVDFRRLISFHQQHNSPITMCTRKYEFQVPFGVVNIQDGQAHSIDEKPTHAFNVSAGVYVINKELLLNIPKDEFYDMPTLIEDLTEKDVMANCFPMVERWIDIGQVGDLEFARSVYGEQND